MSDLIDRQALLDECLNHYEVGNIEQNCTMDWICKTVRNFPAASPWHSMEDGLPKQGEWVLVKSCLVQMSTDFIDKTWHWYRTPGVTHWMPLPEPPKEDA